MRALCSLIVVAILLAISAAVLAHTADDPFKTDLIAGNPKNNGNVVGRVEVWNDGDNLYVKYVVDAPYWHLILFFPVPAIQTQSHKIKPSRTEPRQIPDRIIENPRNV